MKKPFSNIELVTIAVYLLGGDSKYVDTEDIAVKTNEMAPGRFAWRKYPDQINLQNVGKRLSDAKNLYKGGYIIGSYIDGWILSENGLEFCNKRVKDLEGANISRPPLNKKEMAWLRHEKTRMLTTIAFEKVNNKNPDAVTAQEAETFFRLDDYVTGKARERKLDRIVNAFREDPDLNEVIEILTKKIRKYDVNNTK